MVIEDRITDIFSDPKNVLNRGVGYVLLAYSAPLFLVVAGAVALDSGSGPVLVPSRSDGSGSPSLLEFSTGRGDDGSRSALGGVLRRTRLELLPRLINVARGDITVMNVLR